MSPKNNAIGSSEGLQEIAIQLSESLRSEAERVAISEGVSLEDFILYAIAEKIALSESPDRA